MRVLFKTLAVAMAATRLNHWLLSLPPFRRNVMSFVGNIRFGKAGTGSTSAPALSTARETGFSAVDSFGEFPESGMQSGTGKSKLARKFVACLELSSNFFDVKTSPMP